MDPRTPVAERFNAALGYNFLKFFDRQDLKAWELNLLQRIQQHYLKLALDRILRPGIIGELGGTIGPASEGFYTGAVTAESSGSFLGLDTIMYRVFIKTGGAPGTATFDYMTTGDDPSTGPVTITAWNTWHAVGHLGAMIRFADNGDTEFVVTPAGSASWIITCTYQRELPTVEGQTISMLAAYAYIGGRTEYVPASDITFPAATSGKSIVYVEAMTRTVTVDDDAELVDDETLELLSQREKTICSFKGADTSGDPLPAGYVGRIVVPAYEWDRETDEVQRVNAAVCKFDLNDLTGMLLADRVQHVAYNDELSGILAERTFDESGSYICEEKDLECWINGDENSACEVRAAQASPANTGDDTAASSGEYLGAEDQIYTIVVSTGGAPGVAKITVTGSAGDDSGPTTVAAFGAAVGIGTLGAYVSIADGGDGLLSAGDSWTVECVTKTIAMMTNKGKAYVRGLPYLKTKTELLRIPAAVTTAAIEDEALTFDFGDNIVAPQMTGGNYDFPVKAIDRASARVTVRRNITRGSAGGADTLPLYPVGTILAVFAGDPAYHTGTGATYDFSGSGPGARAVSFKIQASPWAGGPLGTEQTIWLRPKPDGGAWTQAQVLEALNQGTGPAYHSGSANLNLYYCASGGQIMVQTLAGGSVQVLRIGTGTANAALGFVDETDGTPGTSTQYDYGTSWIVDGPAIDWSPGGPEPTPGTTYQVVWTYTKELVEKSDDHPTGYDYVFHGELAEGEAFYAVSVVRGGQESLPSEIVSVVSEGDDIARLTWQSVYNAQEYRVYRGAVGSSAQLGLLAILPVTVDDPELQPDTITFDDAGYWTPETTVHPATTGANLMPAVEIELLVQGMLNFNAPDRCTGTTGEVTISRPFPESGSITLDYDYYQPRYTVRAITAAGEIIDIHGDPADEPRVPESPEGCLPLAKFYCPPDSWEVSISNYRIRATKMPELRAMAVQIENLRLNDAELSGILQAKAQEAASLRGVFADSFTTTEQGDTTHPDYDCAIDPVLRCLRLPFDVTTVQLALKTSEGSSEEMHGSKASAPKNLYMVAYGDELAVGQDVWCREQLVNPHAYYAEGPKPTPWIVLSPARDYWCDTTVISNTDFILEYWYVDPNTGITDPKTAEEVAAARARGVDPLAEFETIRNELKFLREQQALYARPIPVEVYGMNFTAGTQVSCKMSDRTVSLTPVPPWTSGAAGTVIVDSFGFFRATFTVPSGIGLFQQLPTGPHTVTASSVYVSGPHIGEAANTCSATFTSEGEVNIFEERKIKAHYYIDPIAQTFRIPSGGYLTKIDLPLASKDPATALQFMLRDVDSGGDPTDMCDHVESRHPSAVNVGETSHNYFFPDDPVEMGEADYRAIALLTDSVLGYKAYAATGGTEDHLGQFLSAHPYADGTFLTSSNATTWTPHPDDAMRFSAYRAKFSTADPAILTFDDIIWDGHSEVTGFMVIAGQVAPVGTSILWEYQWLDQADSWQPGDDNWRQVSPMSFTELPDTAKKLRLRATLSTTDERVSPAIAKGTVSIALAQNKLEGTYLNLTTDFIEPVENVSVYIEELNPAGTGATADAEVTSDYAGDYVIEDGVSDALKIKVGDAAVVTVDLAGGTLTASDVTLAINDAFDIAGQDPVAETVSGRVRLFAPATIEIQDVANDAYSVLGFRVGSYLPFSGGHVVMLSPNGGKSWMTPEEASDPIIGDDGFAARRYGFAVGDDLEYESVKVKIIQKTAHRQTTPLMRGLKATMT